MATLAFQRVSFTYPSADEPTLCEISLSLKSGGFYVLCGPTGSGKSTLLRTVKPELCPVGLLSGARTIDGRELTELAVGESARLVGFVMQNPETQIVTDTVWHELAFGLENLGLNTPEIRRRVAETAQFFGIQTWFNQRVNNLSGGQKQILNLAAIMAMQPELLILDEPTSQLDPIAAKEFIAALTRINQELGCTVLVAEHRLDDVLPLADEVLFLKEGALTFKGSPTDFARYLYKERTADRAYLPLVTRIGHVAADRAGARATISATQRDGTSRFAFSVKEARNLVALIAPGGARDASYAQQTLTHNNAIIGAHHDGPSALKARDLWFRYDKKQEPVVRGLDLDIAPQTIHCIVGGNASGKSTLLNLLAGGIKPLRGSLARAKNQRCSLLTQNPQALFVCDTLRADLLEVAQKGPNPELRVAEQLQKFGLEKVAESHPYDLSGGEMQKAALAKVMLVEPDIILLDEPTKGLDVRAKQECGELLLKLKEAGKTLVVVSHDLDFVAQYGDVCSLLFDGSITATNTAHEFFLHNTFYTTNTYRTTRGLIEGCVTFDDFRTYVSSLSSPSETSAHD